MSNSNITREYIDIVRKTYREISPEVISYIEITVKEKIEKIWREKYRNDYEIEKYLNFGKKEIVEQITKEISLFIDNKINNNESADNAFLLDRRKATIEELYKLLETAESIEKNEYFLSRRRDFLSILMFLAALSISFLTLLPSTISFVSTTAFYVIVMVIIFATTASLLKISKEYNKEKRALEKIVSVIQEIVPYYLNNMSVIERANFEVKLARMNIHIANSNF